MAEFLTTQGTSYYIENIIKNAKNELILISPYLKLSKTLLERLKDAEKRNIKIILVYGKDELNPDERSKLRQLNNLSLYFIENLHAKCFCNEESMVITSMNMYEFSEKNNREMGVLIRAKDDRDVFSKALEEIKSIINASKQEDLRKSSGDSHPSKAKTKTDSQKPTIKNSGYCIKCRKPIPYDLDRPYCETHFKVWAKWKNFDYEESYCHTCGEPDPTTKAMPQCKSCYWSQR